MPSSVIARMQYNAADQTLTLFYRGNRGVYRYFNVSEEQYAAFRESPSKGAYLNQIFKPQHPFVRLNPSQVIHLVRKPPQSTEPAQHGEDNRRGHR